MANSSPIVQVDNVFVLSGPGLSAATGLGSFEVNSAILSTAAPRQRESTFSLVSDGPSAAVSGLEHSAGRLIPAMPMTGKIIAVGASAIGKFNDAISVGQHLVQGNGAEAFAEGLGVAGGATGAWAGATAAAALGSTFALSAAPFAAPLGALLGGFGGALFIGQGARAVGEWLTEGDTPGKLAPPQTLPFDTPLQPTIITAEGDRYALVLIEGKYTWFAMLDKTDLDLANPFVEVVSGPKMAALTNAYLQESGFAEQLADYTAAFAEQQRQLLQDSFARSELEYGNKVGPDGQDWGTASRLAGNVTQTWLQSPQAGQALNIIEIKNGETLTRVVQEVDRATGTLLGEKTYESDASGGTSTLRLVATADYQSGASWTLNRETGQMQSRTMPGYGAAHVAASHFNPNTALASQPGDHSITIQAGDTVSSMHAFTAHHAQWEPFGPM